MKSKLFLFALLLTATSLFAGNSNPGELFSYDKTQVATQLNELNNLENYVTANPGSTMENLAATNNSLVKNINGKSATFSGDNNRIVAILLCFFLGGLGIHHAYLDAGTGIIFKYCITCGGIFGVLPLIDFITLLISPNWEATFVGNTKLIAY